MNLCKKCKKPTNYLIEDIPICFDCICEIESKASVNAILEQAEFITGISYEQMQTRSRVREIVEAKYYAMYLLREANIGTLSFIGDLFGLDHATVMHGIKKIKELIEFKQLDYGSDK